MSEKHNDFPTAKEFFSFGLAMCGHSENEPVSQADIMDEVVMEIAYGFYRFGFAVARCLCGRSEDHDLEECRLLRELAVGKSIMVDSPAERRLLKPDFWKPYLTEKATRSDIGWHRRLARLILEAKDGKELIEEMLKEPLPDDPRSQEG